MRHSVDELVNIVYDYYPRGLLSNDPRYKDAEVYFGVGVNDDTMFILPAGIVKPEFIDPPLPLEAQRQDIRFDFSPDEHPYTEWIARDIEVTWGYERMPLEVGKVIVPDVSTNSRALGEATLYDCLFSDDW